MYKRVSVVLVACLIIFSGVSPSAVAVSSDTQPPTGYIPTTGDGDVSAGASLSLGLQVSDDVGVTGMKVYVNSVEIDSGDFGITYKLNSTTNATNAQISWDTTKIPNATHKVQFEALDAAGNKGWLVTSSGQNYINVVVNNEGRTTTKVTPQSGVSTTSETAKKSSCTSSQAKLDALVKRIVTRAGKRVDTLDKTIERLQKHYAAESSEENSMYLDDAVAVQGRVGEKFQELQDMRVQCDADPKSDVAKFKAALSQLEEELIKYRENIAKVVDETV